MDGASKKIEQKPRNAFGNKKFPSSISHPLRMLFLLFETLTRKAFLQMPAMLKILTGKTLLQLLYT